MRAALGFKLHTGWAAVVAIAGGPADLRILLRRRVELLPRAAEVPRFVYHAAAELTETDAATLVQRAEKVAHAAAREAVRQVIQEVQAKGGAVWAAGIAGGSTRVPDDLRAVLRSHALIHAAEGLLFQRALTAACEYCGLHVTTSRERGLWGAAAAALGLPEAELLAQLNGIRKSAGPPWGADQKTAAAAGLLAMSARVR
jgi:hypothetical protein